MANRDVEIKVEGFRELRAAYRALDSGVNRDLTAGLRNGLGPVLREAQSLAPHRTGRLARSLRLHVRGNTVSIGSGLPYANVIHWGGTTGYGHSRHHRGATHIRESLFITRAVEANGDMIVNQVGDEIMSHAHRLGL